MDGYEYPVISSLKNLTDVKMELLDALPRTFIIQLLNYGISEQSLSSRHLESEIIENREKKCQLH